MFKVCTNDYVEISTKDPYGS